MKIDISFCKFFSDVQESLWYNEFLEPIVVDVSSNSKVLDIGTGTGKLLQLLVEEKSASCTGIDISASMLVEAEKKLNGLSVKLIQVKPGDALSFQNNCFDIICICNVLFHLDYPAQMLLMKQSLEFLKENGRIIALTPTGKGATKKFIQKFLKKNNKSFALWYALTRRNARRWGTKLLLKEYAKRYMLSYTNSLVFDGFGLMETIKRK